MLVLIETPFIDTLRHMAYLRDALKDSFARGEAPISVQSSLRLIGAVPEAKERQHTTETSMLWCNRADRIVFYSDLGITPEMQAVLRMARINGKPVEYRYLPVWACACDEHVQLGFRLAPECSRHGHQPSFI